MLLLLTEFHMYSHLVILQEANVELGQNQVKKWRKDQKRTYLESR